MNRSHLVVLAAVLTLTATAQADETSDVVARLGVAAGCKEKNSALRAWCPAASWTKGKAGTLKSGIMAGVTVAIEADADVKQALSDRVSFVVLAVRRDGKKLVVTLQNVTPDNDGESEMVAKAVWGVASVLKGAAKEVVLDADLRGFADSLVPAADRTVTKTKTSWAWENDHNRAELRQMASAWVVIETPKTGGAGRFVTVLTSRVK